MGMRKTVHFSASIDDDILAHANSFGNFSAYTKKLIREDMLRNPRKGKRDKTQIARQEQPSSERSTKNEVAPTVSQPPARPRKYIQPQQPNNPPPFRPKR